MMKSFRVYFDTSVIGGCLDEEFAVESRKICDLVLQGKITMLLSDFVIVELETAPKAVQVIFQELLAAAVEQILITPEVIQLRNAYLAAGILTDKSRFDATHVAAATIAKADAIVSWNFRHIVRLDKMKAFNQVNLSNGYDTLTIVSPKEVNLDDVNEL
ncbi:MAG: PIN domain-containing protein [Cyanobacteria bacterium P01_H01_bin.152]